MNACDKIALILFFVSIVVVAIVMELMKAYKKRKPSSWWILSSVLSIICTTSVWFGVDHTGRSGLLPLVLIAGYVGQYLLDMYGVKKALTKIFNAYASKHGYTKIEECENVHKT